MSFKIIQNDITKIKAEAIVCTSKQSSESGEIPAGKSAWTESFNLKKSKVKYIIHTALIPYKNDVAENTEILRNCYISSLNMAKELGCKSVAVPLLGTGDYGFPKEICIQVAKEEISKFLLENELEIILAVYDTTSDLIQRQLFDDVQSFINENYTVITKYSDCCSAPDIPVGKMMSSRICRELFDNRTAAVVEDINEDIDEDIGMEDFINQSYESLNFQNTLQKLIAERKLENAFVYTKALIDRKFFSKIISTKNYVPKKMTVMALGLALELQLEEYETFLASAGYAFMPSSKFDVIIKYCVMNHIYNLIEVDMILFSHGEDCFASE